MTTFRETFDAQGVVVVQGLVTPEELDALREACDTVVARTRDGNWALRRTVGKQFPPYGDTNPDSWGVQMLMHPDLGEPATVFADWYTGDKLTTVVRELLQCQEEDLQMELFNLLINRLSHDFALRWHRDDIKNDASNEEEEQALKLWNHGMQWNTALYDDSCLFIVPGTHKYPRTPEQRALSITLDAPKNPLDMPGAMAVHLKAGETVFYNSNLLHLGTYSAKYKRATLHGTMGDTRGGAVRARNILQHGLEWMKEDRFKKGLSARGRTMLDHLVEMQARAGDVGYSLH